MRDSPGYSEFLQHRGNQGFWVTTELAYRLGAVLALCAFRCRVTPNCVSFCSLLLGVGGVTAIAGANIQGALGAVLVGSVLVVSYGLDCADGLLARATGQGSMFGGILDKTFDILSAVFIPLMLCWQFFVNGLQSSWEMFGVVLLVGVRVGFTVMIWLKEALLHGLKKIRTDERPRDRAYRIKKMIGNITDELTYRVALAVSWGIGMFWHFAMGYGLLLLGIMVAYAVATKKELDSIDQSA